MFELTREEQKRIHSQVLRILHEVGVEIGHPKILEALDGIGARIDKAAMRARFDADLVEAFLAACPKTDRQDRRPELAVRASLYSGKYHDPETGKLVPFEPRHLTDYFRLAKVLPHVTGYFVTGCQWRVPPETEPLWERFHAWKYGLQNSNTLYPLESADSILALCETYAALKNLPVRNVAGGGVFMMSPLRLSAEEADQFVWWWQRGFRVGISHMSTAGLSAPVTLPGLVALHLAEAVAIGLVDKACYGGNAFPGGAMIAPADMRTMIRPYGRPEMAVANGLWASMTRFYGVDCWVQSGLTEAKLPSVEAGAQKTMTTLSALAEGADTLLDAGTLSIDQVFSPIQMILDHELAGALQRMLERPRVTEETVAADVVREVEPGGLFTGTMHTAKHFRDEIWEPRVWGRQMLQAWEEAGGPLDVDRAAALYREWMADAPDPSVLTPDEEETLLKVIRRAEAGDK